MMFDFFSLVNNIKAQHLLSCNELCWTEFYYVITFDIKFQTQNTPSIIPTTTTTDTTITCGASIKFIFE